LDGREATLRLSRPPIPIRRVWSWLTGTYETGVRLGSVMALSAYSANYPGLWYRTPWLTSMTTKNKTHNPRRIEPATTMNLSRLS
jgi:hypothetical protein